MNKHRKLVYEKNLCWRIEGELRKIRNMEKFKKMKFADKRRKIIILDAERQKELQKKMKKIHGHLHPR
jgi:hypothetical protein